MQYNTREKERERERERERESLDGPAWRRAGAREILRGEERSFFTYTEYGQQRRGLAAGTAAAMAAEGRGKEKTAKFYNTRGEIAV